MSFIFAAAGITLILLAFGLWEGRRIGRTHGRCASRDISLMASMRLVIWAMAMSIAGLVLVPAAHAPEVRIAFVSADLMLGAAVYLLRRQAQRAMHDVR